MRRAVNVLAVALALIAAACGGGDETATTPGQGAAVDTEAVVRVAAAEDTWPLEGEGVKSRHFAYPLNVNVYEPLVQLGSDYTLRPAIAERWELLPPNTWRFHLRRGVRFHDGTPLTADDVIWSWQRQVEGKILTTVTNTLGPESVKKIDDFTVDFTPTVPNLRLPEQIVHPNGATVPTGRHADTMPVVGTGPFKLVEYVRGQRAVVERNDDYWGEKAKVKRMEIRFLPDPQTRIEALKAGEVDFVIDLPHDAVATVEGDDRFRVVKSKPGRNQLIYVNKSGKAPFDLGTDKAVREAVSLAIDREAYVETVFEGQADPGRWMAPASVLGNAADTVKAPAFDPRRARQVLEDAGWTAGPDGIRAKDGRRLSLTIIGWAEVSDAAFQFIQAQLKDVGIDVAIKKAPDQATYQNLYRNTEFDLDLEVPNQNDGNPAFLPVLRMYTKSTGTERFAPGGAFDTQAERALAATTQEEAQRASAEMMRILINDEFIVVPLAGVYRVYGMTRSVNLGDPHPSQTNQSWLTLTKSR